VRAGGLGAPLVIMPRFADADDIVLLREGSRSCGNSGTVAVPMNGCTKQGASNRALSIVLDSGTIVLTMGTNSSPGALGGELARVLFGQTRQRVLGWMYAHPDEAFYLRQIVRQTGGAHGAIQRELQALTSAGLLRREARGRHVYFQANRDSPIFLELQSILAKTVGLVDLLREALSPLSDKVRVAFVFGSAARNELRSGSDMDVVVIGDVTFAEVVAALGSAQERLGREVNPTVYSASEFREKVRVGHHFLTTVLSEPMLFLVGGPDELGRLGAKRVAEGASDERDRDPRSPRRGRARSPRQRR
jgi:predicted nucleotidyltransferase